MQVCSNGCRMPNGKPRTAPRTSVIDGKRRLCRQCAAEEAELDERAVRQRRREMALMAEQAEAAEAAAAAATGAGAADSPASASAAKASSGHGEDEAKGGKSKKRKNAADDNNDASDDDRRRRIIRSRIDMSFFTYPGFFWVDDIPPQAGAEIRARTKSNGRDDHCEVADISKMPAEKKEGRKITDTSKRKAAASVDAGLCANDDAASAKTKSSPSNKARGNGPTSKSGKSPVRRASPKRAAKDKSGNGAATDSDHIFEGRWTETELKRLARGIRAHGHQWKKVAACVRTRTPWQCKVENDKLIDAQIDSWPKRGK